MAVRKEILIGTGLIVGVLGLFLYLVKRAARAPAPPVETARVYGRVTDKYSKEPVSGVDVRLVVAGVEQLAITDENGQYEFADVTVGQSFGIRFTKEGYVKAEMGTTLPKGGLVVSLAMKPL